MSKSRFEYKALKNLALITHIGLVMMIPIFGGVYLGSYLDERFGTGGIFLIVLTLIGVVTAFLNMFKVVMKAAGKRDDDDRFKG